jgi:hypothetical protein
MKTKNDVILGASSYLGKNDIIWGQANSQHSTPPKI